MKGSPRQRCGYRVKTNEMRELPDMLVFVGFLSRGTHRRSARSDLERARIKISRNPFTRDALYRREFFDSRSRRNGENTPPVTLFYRNIFAV